MEGGGFNPLDRLGFRNEVRQIARSLIDPSRSTRENGRRLRRAPYGCRHQSDRLGRHSFADNQEQRLGQRRSVRSGLTVSGANELADHRISRREKELSPGGSPCCNGVSTKDKKKKVLMKPICLHYTSREHECDERADTRNRARWGETPAS